MDETRERAEVLAAVEECRAQLHRTVDERMDKFIGDLFRDVLEARGAVHSLCADPSVFKGEKPSLLILPDGSKMEVSTWKKAVSAIMQNCSSDSRRHMALMELRGKVCGNFREILAASPEGMGSPLRIDEGLYLESKFDTEALLRNLTSKVLDRAGYDYRSVVIQCREPQMEQEAAEEQSPLQMGQVLS